MNFLNYGYSIENYITDELHLPLERGGRYICCPLHDEDHASCRVYEETDSFYCFGCNQGGDVVQLHRLIAKKNGKLLDYKTTIREMAEIVSKATGKKVEINGNGISKQGKVTKSGEHIVRIQPISKLEVTSSISENDRRGFVATLPKMSSKPNLIGAELHKESMEITEEEAGQITDGSSEGVLVSVTDSSSNESSKTNQKKMKDLRGMDMIRAFNEMKTKIKGNDIEGVSDLFIQLEFLDAR